MSRKAYMAEYQKTHAVAIAKRKAAYYKAHAAEISINRAVYYRAHAKEYRKIHSDEILKREAERRKNPTFKLSHNISRGMHKGLKQGKSGRHWESLVGYTAIELKAHLEGLFRDGMTWENYGEWHIDHRIPKSTFNYTKTSDLDFEKCWALDNLQPLWAHDNISKGDRMEMSFHSGN